MYQEYLEAELQETHREAAKKFARQRNVAEILADSKKITKEELPKWHRPMDHPALRNRGKEASAAPGDVDAAAIPQDITFEQGVVRDVKPGMPLNAVEAAWAGTERLVMWAGNARTDVLSKPASRYSAVTQEMSGKHESNIDQNGVELMTASHTHTHTSRKDLSTNANIWPNHERVFAVAHPVVWPKAKLKRNGVHSNIWQERRQADDLPWGAGF